MLGGLLFQGCFWKPRCDGQHLGLFCLQLCAVALKRGEGLEIVPTAGEMVLGQAVVLAEGLRVLEQRIVDCASESMGRIAYKLSSLILRSCKDRGGN